MSLDIAHYLQEHLLGEVTASPEVRRYFAHDSSILQSAPAVVAYPRNEDDVRKIARFTWQLAERGRVISITPRGGGSDTTGAAIGSGILVVFTAHMNKLLSLNAKKKIIELQPGLVFDKLEQTLHAHELSLPTYPTSHAFSTVGGALAKNSVGEKSVKYGSISKYVQKLRVVLANGEVIETKELNKRELNKKLGLSSLEGEIYRSLDKLLEENSHIISETKAKIVSKHNSAGFNIFDVKINHGFNLTPLIVGSQGALGLVTEATLKVVSRQPSTKLALVSLEKLTDLNDALPKILNLNPSICDLLNKSAIDQISKINPSQLKSVLDPTHAEIHLLVEFDDQKDASQKHAVKALKKIVDKADGYIMVAESKEDQQQIWKIRHSVNTLLVAGTGQARPIPIADDISVPVEHLVEFLAQAEQLVSGLGISPSFWGHAGSGVIKMSPVLDLAQVGDRQKMFKLTDLLYSLAISLGGSIAAGAGDGRTKSPYLPTMYDPQILQIMMQVKKIFDPHGILNSGVKTSSAQDVKDMLRTNFSRKNHEHLIRN